MSWCRFYYGQPVARHSDVDSGEPSSGTFQDYAPTLVTQNYDVADSWYRLQFLLDIEGSRCGHRERDVEALDAKY